MIYVACSSLLTSLGIKRLFGCPPPSSSPPPPFWKMGKKLLYKSIPHFRILQIPIFSFENFHIQNVFCHFLINLFASKHRGIRGKFFRGGKIIFPEFFPGVKCFFLVENSHFGRSKTNFSGFEKWKAKKKKKRSSPHFLTCPPSIFNFPPSLFRFSFFSSLFSLFSFPVFSQ